MHQPDKAPTLRSPQRASRAGLPGRVPAAAARSPTQPFVLRLLITLLVFSTFFSGVKFVPGIGTNIGPFEATAVLLILYFFFDTAGHRDLQLSTMSWILLMISVWAAISQFNIRPENRLAGLIQTLIVLNLFLVVTIFDNLARRFRLSPQRMLTLVTLAVLVAGPWVIFSGIASGGDIQASGPFRNRAHVATYMLTAFWMVVIFLLLPAVRTRLRWAGYLAAAASLYSVSVSGRRSAYLALFVGLAGLSLAFLVARRGKRVRMFATAGFAVAFIWLFYSYGSLLVPQATFFQQRVGTVGSRLRAFVSPQQETAENNFYLLQREGVKLAFSDSPVMGIGWGGFARSRYSPTGHEVHSTPLRFVAELGLVGLLLYLCFMGHFLLEALRLFLRMRHTPYGSSFLAFLVATSSLCVSYIYNRHITERTFWLYLAIFVTMRAFSERVVPTPRRRSAAQRAAGGRDAGPPRPAGGSPAPAEGARLRSGRVARRPIVWQGRRR